MRRHFDHLMSEPASGKQEKVLSCFSIMERHAALSLSAVAAVFALAMFMELSAEYADSEAYGDIVAYQDNWGGAVPASPGIQETAGFPYAHETGVTENYLPPLPLAPPDVLNGGPRPERPPVRLIKDFKQVQEVADFSFRISGNG